MAVQYWIRLFLLVVVISHSLCLVPTHGQQWIKLAPNLERLTASAPKPAQLATSKRFVSLPSEQTGIDFVERLDWEHPQGQLFYLGYACGGIAVGDVDGNGLPDLFFAGGSGRSRLYMQRAPWEFTEAAADAGILIPDQPSWSTGATLFDIDNDGDLDLYVCKYDAANCLYVNRGDGTFDERAAEYGLDIVDASLIASVADYDCDGDLDVYLAMNRYLEEKQFSRRDLFYWRDGMEFLRPSAEKYFVIRRHIAQAGQLNMWAGRKDRLLCNEGAGHKFTDVSDQMGLERGDTLSATWWDYDHDGRPDLYVANDLAAPDRLFHNRVDDSFEDVTLQSLPHTPWQAMGASTGDINNDGLVDCLVADMSFRTHFKDKLFMGDMSNKFRNISVFPNDQLMRNALYVNTGTEKFQEAAYLSGLASTDWTWSAKLADFDNDGRIDAYFTNGSPVNLSGSGETDNARANGAELDSTFDSTNLRQKYKDLPPVLEQNLVYRNQGELAFVDRSQSWGLDDVGMSFAAVHADLDRDGDLDLVVANLDRPPLVYRNDSQQAGIVVELIGSNSNRMGVGAEIVIETAVGAQVRQVYPVAGYQSCQEVAAHFGLGPGDAIKRMEVHWPSGVVQVFQNIPKAARLRVSEPLTETMERSATSMDEPMFNLIQAGPKAEHHEEPFDEFARQPLLPNRLSQLGPPVAWADIDGDGDSDYFLGEGTGWMGMIYVNEGDFRFKPQPQVALSRDGSAEDTAAAFFDANGDGNYDLYVGSGSVEYELGDTRLRDRLYLGDGNAGFEQAPESWLPDLRNSTAAVEATDFDRDGDVDLFVGSRSVPGEYPVAPQHALLVNTGERFENAIDRLAPQLATAGMVTDAAWVDVDGNGWDDLLVATDWGSIRLFLNDSGRLVEATEKSGLGRWSGWWQSLAYADFDNDGDMDFVAGNFGLNTKYHASAQEPVVAYYGEYGEAGQKNFVEASYEGQTLFPVRGRSCSSTAIPHLAKRFSSYEQFAKASLAEIYTPACLEESQRIEVNSLGSSCFLNDGAGHFSRTDLPADVQLAPVFAIAVTDANDDGVPDLYCGQNFFGPQRETGPMDGGVGVLALGRGDGTFATMRPDRAGIVVSGDTKAVSALDIDGDGREEICVANNDGPVQTFTRMRSDTIVERPIDLQANQAWVQQELRLAKQFASSNQELESLPYLRRILKIESGNPVANLMLAGVRREQRRFREAAKLLDRLDADGTVEQAYLLAQRGRLWFEMQQYDLASECLREAEALRPADADICGLLGEVYLVQGKLRQAAAIFRKAELKQRLAEVEQTKRVAQTAFDQGVEAQQSGDDANAIKLFEQSRRIDARPETLRSLAKLLQTTSNERLRDEWLAKQLLMWSQLICESNATE